MTDINRCQYGKSVDSGVGYVLHVICKHPESNNYRCDFIRNQENHQFECGAFNRSYYGAEDNEAVEPEKVAVTVPESAEIEEDEIFESEF